MRIILKDLRWFENRAYMADTVTSTITVFKVYKKGVPARPSRLLVTPTKSEDEIISEVEDYGWKASKVKANMRYQVTGPEKKE
jgi:hypothetical protein